MMKTFNKFTIWLILFTWLTGNGCTKDTTCSGADFNNLTKNYFNLPPLYKKNVPYSIHDTIHFVDNNFNEFHFVLLEIDSGYNFNEVASQTPGCPAHIDCAQYFNYNFKEINDKASLQLMNMINNDELKDKFIYVKCNVNEFFLVQDALTDSRLFINRIFNNHSYDKVRYTCTKERLDTIFYSLEKGIIAIINQDTNTFYLR